MGANKILLVWVLVSVVAFATPPLSAKPPGNYGFGPPPSYPDVVVRLVGGAPAESEWANIRVTRPEAACLDRGGFRRDVCGYVLCASLPNRYEGEYWITVGYGVWEQGATKRCPRPVAESEAWRGDPPVQVRRFCDVQPKFSGCRSTSFEGYMELSVEDSRSTTFAERVERDNAAREAELAEQKKREAEALVEQQRKEAEALALKLKLMAALRATRWQGVIEDNEERGTTAVYVSLASAVYSGCREYADDVFDIDAKPGEAEVRGLNACASEAQILLLDRIKPALARSKSAELSQQIKDLHAYTIASLRALENYRQSVIEARQDRSARMLGIDERVARIELDLR